MNRIVLILLLLVAVALPSSCRDTSIRQTHQGRLLERAPPNGGPVQTSFGHGWEIKHRQYSSFIIPVQVAASVLEEFYTDCLKQIALKAFQNKPNPGNAFTFNIGSVYLAFKLADQTQGLDWLGCELIVNVLLVNARAGLTTQFKSEWFHPETNKLVYVSLSILQRIAPGRVQGD